MIAFGFFRLTPDQFWNFTPKEFGLMSLGFEKRYSDGKPKKMSSQEINSNVDEALELIRERRNSSGSRESD